MDSKIVMLLWRPGNGDSLKNELIEVCTPQLEQVGAKKIVMNIRDDASLKVRSPAPSFHKTPDICGQVNVWLDEETDPKKCVDVVKSFGFSVAAYLVEESIYKDYGDNAHAEPRYWPDGSRSPGVSLITLMPRPRRLQRNEWVRRWFGNMSPVSESIQPRTRYVRNLVQEKITLESPDYEGIVEEAWPSPRHVHNPFLFYGAKNPLALIINMSRILIAVLSFLNLFKIRFVIMSEYFIKTRLVS